MNTTPFNDDELDEAKLSFARAFFREKQTCAFDPDPFRAALTIWNEDNGQLPKALWAVHAAKWHKSPEIADMLAGFEDELADEERAEKIEAAAEIQTDEFKLLVKAEMIAELRKMMKNPLIEAKDRTGAMDRLSKLMNLDEKPKVDEDTGKILGVIHHRLSPMTPDQFAEFSRRQQGDLQNELVSMAEGEIIDITAEPDVRTIN